MQEGFNRGRCLGLIDFIFFNCTNIFYDKFTTDKNNIVEAVQSMKMSFKWLCQIEGAKSDQLILHKPS